MTASAPAMNRLRRTKFHNCRCTNTQCRADDRFQKAAALLPPNDEAQLVSADSKNAITLARSSADVSPPYGFMLLPGTISSGFAMKRSSFSLSHTKSAPHGTGITVARERARFPSDDIVEVRAQA